VGSGKICRLAAERTLSRRPANSLTY
jgi:hypothetical protein